MNSYYYTRKKGSSVRAIEIRCASDEEVQEYVEKQFSQERSEGWLPATLKRQTETGEVLVASWT